MIKKVRVTISPTATGKGYFIQVLSEDQMSVNLTVVTEEVELKDSRK